MSCFELYFFVKIRAHAGFFGLGRGWVWVQKREAALVLLLSAGMRRGSVRPRRLAKRATSLATWALRGFPYPYAKVPKVPKVPMAYVAVISISSYLHISTAAPAKPFLSPNSAIFGSICIQSYALQAFSFFRLETLACSVNNTLFCERLTHSRGHSSKSIQSS